MNSRMYRVAVTAVCLVVLAAFGSLLGGSSANAASTTQQTFLTFYGWYDNTPPGGDISYPKLHSTAGGKGTFSDPITFATSTSELPAGTVVWVPRVKKYFIMEDSCQECGADWSGHGPNGGPGLRHIDLWLGGQGGNAMRAIDCEDALTHYNADNTPTMEPVVVDPPSNEPYDSTPLFNTSNGDCYGGAQPNTTVGQYKNGSSGQCLEDPGNSSTNGTALKTATCNGAAAQRFTFHGAFLVINNLCAANSSGNITINTCTGGPSQQWSINPNGTISDIQTGKKCVRASGTNVVAGSCSGTPSQWAFTSSATTDFSIGVSPASSSVAPGGSAAATVSTAVTAGSAQSVALSASGLPSGASASFNPASVSAGGTSAVTFATSATTPPGTYSVTITGAAGSGSHTATYSLTVTGSVTGGVANGGFETGDFTGWTRSGTTAVTTSGPHTGTNAALLGSANPTNGDSKISQAFTAPTGSSRLSFWYNVKCPDDVTYDWATATLKDNTTGTTTTVLAKTCTVGAGWKQVSAALTAGHTYLLTLVSHDENSPGDATSTTYDDVTVS